MMNGVLSIAPRLALAAASSAGPSVPVVVITGLVLVFLILILLTLILVGEGKLFENLDKRKKGAAKPPEQAAPKQAAPAAAPVAQGAGLVVEPGISPQVVAAIAAAVNEMENGRYVLRSVSTATRHKGRGPWGTAGVVSYTEPF